MACCDVIPANRGVRLLTSMIPGLVDPELARTLTSYVTLGLDLMLVARLEDGNVQKRHLRESEGIRKGISSYPCTTG